MGKSVKAKDQMTTQLATAEQHKKFFDFLREEHESLLSLFTDETIMKKAKQFVFEQEAAAKLDADAVAEGYESAAHKAFSLNEEKKAAEAKAKAEAEAIAAAKKKKEDEELAAQVEAERIAQLKRDLQDAEDAAKKKAEAKAAVIAKDLEG